MAGCLAGGSVQGLAGIFAVTGLAVTALAAALYLLRFLKQAWRPQRTCPFSPLLLFIGFIIIPATLASVDPLRSVPVSVMVLLVYFAFFAAREAFSAQAGGVCSTGFCATVVALAGALAVSLRFLGHFWDCPGSVLPWFSLAPGDKGEPARFFDHMFAFLMVVSFPLVFAAGMGGLSRRRLLLICSAFPALGIVLSFSRAAWIAFFCEAALLGIFGVVRRRTALAAGLVVVALWAAVPGALERTKTIFATQQGTNLQRIEQWGVAFNMLARSPFLGYGPGTFTAVYREMRGSAQPRDYPSPHNLYLHIAAELGLPAFFLFCAGMYAMFCALWPRAKDEGAPPGAPAERCLRLGAIASLAGVLVFGLFDL